jgi:hypothetical protein
MTMENNNDDSNNDPPVNVNGDAAAEKVVLADTDTAGSDPVESLTEPAEVPHEEANTNVNVVSTDSTTTAVDTAPSSSSPQQEASIEASSEVIVVMDPQQQVAEEDDDDEDEASEKTAEDTAGYSADQSLQTSAHNSTSNINAAIIATPKHHGNTNAAAAAMPPTEESAEEVAVSANGATRERMTEATATTTANVANETDTKQSPAAVAVVEGLAGDKTVARQKQKDDEVPCQDKEVSHSNYENMTSQNLGKLDPNSILLLQKVGSKEEFVNVGLAHWEEQRKAWLAMNRPEETAPFTVIPVDVDEIIDVIFQSPKQWREEGGPRCFPCNVPLPQMVDILQDLWEAEGLDT